MPKDVSALRGLQNREDQITVNLIAVAIPGLEQYMTDFDRFIYVNLTTGAMSLAPLAPGAGEKVVTFTPTEGLKVPKIEMTDQTFVPTLSVTLANTSRFWKRRAIVGDYRNSGVTIWQGNIDRNGAVAPDLAHFGGSVVAWKGELDQVQALNSTATLLLSPPRPFTAQLGRRYTPDKFKRAPQPGKVDRWGYTTRTL